MATQPTYNVGLLNESAYNPATVEKTTDTMFEAANRTVRPEELSQYQLGQITAANSPLMQQAATKGQQMAARRGLLNTSLAGEAAQGAVIAAAQPFALQDASTYSQAAGANMEATQRTREFLSGQAQQRGLVNAEAVNRAAEMAAAQRYGLQTMGQEQAYKQQLMGLEHQYGLQNMNQEQQYRLQAMGQEQAYKEASARLQQAFSLESLNTEYGLRNAQLALQNQIAKEQQAMATGSEMQKTYLSQVGNMANNYMNGWFKIQESQMTPAEKQAALGQYNTTMRTWQQITNTAFGSMPQWQNQWGMTLGLL